MPIDPALLATSIGTLADLEPEPDLPASLQRAVTAAEQLLDADAAGITLTDATGGCAGPAGLTSAPRPWRRPGGLRRWPLG